MLEIVELAAFGLRKKNNLVCLVDFNFWGLLFCLKWLFY